MSIFEKIKVLSVKGDAGPDLKFRLWLFSERNGASPGYPQVTLIDSAHLDENGQIVELPPLYADDDPQAVEIDGYTQTRKMTHLEYLEEADGCDFSGYFEHLEPGFHVYTGSIEIHSSGPSYDGDYDEEVHFPGEERKATDEELAKYAAEIEAARWFEEDA